LTKIYKENLNQMSFELPRCSQLDLAIALLALQMLLLQKS